MQAKRRKKARFCAKPKAAYGGDFGRACPVCGEGRLSTPNAKANSDKSVLYRLRACDSCGARVADTTIRRREVLNGSGGEEENGAEPPRSRLQPGASAMI